MIVLNKFEKIYVALFVGSMVAGIVYGAANVDYFKCCESALEPEEGFTPLTFFSSNFILALAEMVTAGVASLYLNFHTFSITASYLASQNALFTLPFLFIHGSFELVGSLFLALAGFSFVERKAFKIKSRLKINELVVSGIALIFVGSIVEYGLLKLLG